MLRIVLQLAGIVFLIIAVTEALESPGMSVVYVLFGIGFIYLGRRKQEIQGGDRERSISLETRFLEIEGTMARLPTLDIFGHFSRSRNEEYTLVWSDWDSQNKIGGYRMSGHGSFVLVQNDALVCTGKLERPNDGKVANNGTIAISDWRFGSGLKSRLCCYARDGEEVFRHDFRANMHNIGLSDLGRNGVVQLYHSDSDDSGRLVFIDLLHAKVVWKITPKTGWADSYLFDDNESKLGLIYNDRGTYFYSYTGKFLDDEQWETDLLEHGSGLEILHLCREKFESSENDRSDVKADVLIASIDHALLKDDLVGDPATKAKALRLAGEIHEVRGCTEKAIQVYERALGLDSKVGIKRRLQKLKNDQEGQREQ